MCGLSGDKLPCSMALSLGRSCCSSTVGLTLDPCSEGVALENPGYAMPYVAIDCMERPVKLCNKARNLGDRTGTSPSGPI